ncbi:MAG: LysM peptidoglycan-binding domain-containing protein [Candidatus Electryonea clarkiae]|nr:LysM peptidoglycan-binding domain-containing protein [Candidatus Electryonea clarkiae]MDP8288363.1 LysM peptidoglycan-binding domain-containing protein [Candidatus Electryonea clarkiae]
MTKNINIWILAALIASTCLYTNTAADIPKPEDVTGDVKTINSDSTSNEIDSSITDTDLSSLNFREPLIIIQDAQLLSARADTLLASGDIINAEETLVHAVEKLAEALFDLDPLDRPIWMDTLAVWSRRYCESFSRAGEVVGPGAEGLSTLDVEVLEDTLSSLLDSAVALISPDSLLDVLVPDSVYVELDSTVSEIIILPQIPDTTNKKVENVIEYFTNTERGRKAMTVWLERAGEYIPRMKPILKAHGVPEDLVYLSMIESGFRTDARSYAKAVGPWQFIYSTGKIFNLEMDWWYDQRRDPELAAAAAARYLRQLYEHTGDWYLAMAGYNCGEGRVKREIRRSNSRDFWKLRKLPRQTRGYLPTFLAARRIAKNPTEYGFEPPNYVDPVKKDQVIVSECVDLSVLAKVIGSDVETLRKLNPAIIRWCTPPNREQITINVPSGMNEDFEAKFATIPDGEKTSWVRHRVRAGESLSYIAEKYHTSMQAIKDVPANRIKNIHSLREYQWLLVPVSLGSNYSFAGVKDYSDPDIPSGAEEEIHIVRRGETLSGIAEKHHVGLSKLLRWNGKSPRSVIYPGQRLIVYQPQGFAKKQSKKKPVTEFAGPPNLNAGGKYTIRRGDSPWAIAVKFGVDLDDLLYVNNLSNRSAIHPGNQLVIPSLSGSSSESSAIVYYTIRKGDTLAKVALQYNVTVKDLKNWNNIKNPRRLKIGDRLIIHTSGGA